ncbi:hypothetical protein JMA_22830 [Jeotgalibacillus malaysiensis]|uniref:DUF1510 domain-containing protein n=1 Tax=Jeotgalibacillus malaysiensis TaxID=1508404 RepID=A0A0B5AMS4_9BACL|nr:DUF1510 family protein [Jeotgalibacillus malaysiensis]AJD91600.1 hypothetical protein JMA_22830 [Jeotgalibacillus malaysiensis]
MNSSRSDIQSKKRKQNIFLNSSIAVVFVLIAGVSAFIFFGDNENQAAETEEKTIAEQVQENAGAQDENSNDSNELTASEIDSDDNEESAESVAANEEEEEAAAKKEKEAAEKKEQEAKKKEQEAKKKENEKKEDADTNEDQTRPEDGEFKPIGTEQTGEHVSSYETGSVDWNEKLKAAAYATGLDVNTMTVWWMGNDGGPQNAKAEVASPGAGGPEYRVHMEWVDKKGWKPVKVVELQ